MSAKRVLTIVLVVGAVLLAVGIGPRVAHTARALPPALAGAPAQAGVSIPYSGSLADEAGQPVADGAYDITFALYAAVSGGEPAWMEAQEGVPVQGGAFTALLGSVAPLPNEALDGGARWLEVGVRGPGEAEYTLLSPRQELSAAASASLASPSAAPACAHDHLYENWIGRSTPYAAYTLRVENPTTGDGIRGISYATAADFAGVVGAAYANGGSGVYGLSLYNGRGVYGVSTSGDGVDGTTSGSGTSGVYGHSGDGFGVTGRSTSNYAVAGISENSRGVYGEDAGVNPDNSYAVFANGDMYTDDDLTVSDHLYVGGTSTFVGAKTGYVVDVAQNDDTLSLHTGDVVVISGAGPALLGEIPVIKVRLAREGETSAVVGVVDEHYIPAPVTVQAAANEEAKAEDVFDDAAITPGEYLTVVTLGSFKAIKVDASYGAIAPGDLLVASPNPGYAMHATSPAPGTIIGKALGALESGTGVIPVIVTMQ